MKKTVAYNMLRKIKEEQVSHIFLVPGKNIVPFLMAIDVFQEDMLGVICASELGAGFMADGYSRATHKFGTVITISGPGFNNIFGAIANAYYDGSKLLIICGTPDSRLNGKNAFQDASLYKFDCSILAAGLCSYSCNLNSLGAINQISNVFFYLKNYNLPAFIQVPVNVQMHDLEIDFDSKKIDQNFLNQSVLHRLEEIILENENFIFVTGSRSMVASSVIRSFCEKYHIPVASTLCSKGVISEYKDYYLGLFGFAMSPRTHELLTGEKIKYIIMLGLDFNERNTNQWQALSNKHIINLDSIISENSRDYSTSEETYLTNMALLFNDLMNNPRIGKVLSKSIRKRTKLTSELKDNIPYHVNIDHSNEELLYIDQVLLFLNKIFYDNCNIVVDSGSHRLYCAHLWRLCDAESYYTSINNAHMGWAIAASIGIKLGNPQKSCICITGDGCMLMNGTEVQTAGKYNVKVLFIVLNNNAHGAISSKNLHNNNYYIPDHDWASFSSSLGVASKTVRSLIDLKHACHVFNRSDKPLVLDVKCTYDEKVHLAITPTAYREAMYL